MADPDAMDSESTFVPFTIPERIQQLNDIDKVLIISSLSKLCNKHY